MSDVFVEAWRSSEAYDPEQGSVESWLLGIARNVMRRRRRRREREPEPFDPSDLEELASHRSTPEEEALRDDRRRRLMEAVWRLPREDRDLVALVYGAELSSRRAARLMETTPSPGPSELYVLFADPPRVHRCRRGGRVSHAEAPPRSFPHPCNAALSGRECPVRKRGDRR